MNAPLNRALPGVMIDRIRDGVPRAALASGGDQAVWVMLRRTALSAANRGWDCWEWVELVLEPASMLGQQARLKKGRRLRSQAEIREYLDGIWESATEHLSREPPAWSAKQASDEAQARAAGLQALVADPACALQASDRQVLAYAIERAVALGMTRIALPWRTTAAATGLGERATKNALARLSEAGLLTLAERGRPGGARARKPRANLYDLADTKRLAAYLYRETRSVGPAAPDCGTSGRQKHGTPHQDDGTSATATSTSRNALVVPPTAEEELPASSSALVESKAECGHHASSARTSPAPTRLVTRGTDRRVLRALRSGPPPRPKRHRS